MRKPRTNILLLTAILIVVGVIGQAWLAKKSVAATVARSDTKTVASRVVPFNCTPRTSAGITDTTASTERPAAGFAAIPPQQLSDDATVLVTAMCDLQLMAQGTDLALDSNQWKALAAAVLRCQAIRHTYEAQIATMRMIAPGQYRAEIPMYANAGDELREQFAAELLAQLGEPAARAVMAKLGGRLEKRFAGFGVSVQTLDITANPASERSDIQVKRTASYWNSVEGSDRLTTRSEIHFPVVEDPTGDSWSAMLANVPSAENGSG